MKAKGVLIWAAAAVLLAGFYFLYLQPHKRHEALMEDLSGKFLSGRPDDIEFLKIAHAGTEFIFRKTSGRWMIDKPITTSADNETIKKIIGMIDKERIKKVIPLGDRIKPGEFGFEKPVADMLIGYKGTIEEYTIGSDTPTGNGVYMMKLGVPAVFVVGTDIKKMLGNDLYYFRNKDVFDFDARLVKKIVIIRQRERLDMVKKGAEWEIRGEYSGPGSARDIEAFLDSIRNLRADSFFDEGSVKPYDLKRLTKSVMVEFYSDESKPAWVIEARFWGTGINEGVITWQDGLPYQARVHRDFWNLLQRKAVSFRYRNIFSFDNNEVAEISSEGERHYKFYFRGGEVRKAEGAAVPATDDVAKGLWYLGSLDAVDILGATRPTEVMGNPLLIFTIKKKNGESQELKIYNKSSVAAGFDSSGRELETYYIWSGNLKAWALLKGEDLQKIREGLWK